MVTLMRIADVMVMRWLMLVFAFVMLGMVAVVASVAAVAVHAHDREH